MKQFLEAPELNNILVVDDTPANLHLLTDLLKKYKYEVRPVPNGKLALSTIEINPPDLILLDIMMPDINGYQVCQHLKSNEKTKDIPIIFISAINEPVDKLKGFGLGGVDYITKPFEIKDVLIRIKNQLGVASAQKKLRLKNAKQHETIERLQQMQKKLIKTERTVALDRMFLGITERINPPLQNIHNALSDLDRFPVATVENLPDFLLNISPEQHKYLALLIEKARHHNKNLATTAREAQKQKIVTKLAPFQLSDMDKVADIFTDLGCHEDIDSFLPLLTGKDYLAILENAYLICSLSKNLAAVSQSGKQFSKLLCALQDYTAQTTEEKRQAHIENTIESALKLYFTPLNPQIKLIKKYDRVPPIYCYPEELQKVWLNIIKNAINAMQDGGTLAIDIERKKNNALITISDTGVGVSKELVKQLCVPFFTTTSERQSIGLGLSIVKKIVEKHQGTIAIQSVPGKTKFTVSLPLTANS